MAQINLALESFAALVMAVILIGCIREYSMIQKQSKYFLSMLVMDILMVLSDAGSWLMISIGVDGDQGLGVVRGLMDAASFVTYYAILALFTYYVVDYVSLWVAIPGWIAYMTVPVCVIYAIGWCMSSFNGMFSIVSVDGIARGPMYWFGQIGGYFVLGVSLFLILRHRRVLGKWDTLSLLSFVVFPLLGVVCRMFWSGISYMPLAISLSLILIYNSIHVQQTRKMQEQEIRLAKDRITILLSQIRPHFLYNTLNSIYVLCERDPETAQRAEGDFAEYLRANLESLEKETEIAIERELEHVRHYLRLEKMRFRDELHVEYDIQVVGFRIPPLTLQPIVENAVKHGVTKKKDGGTVRIVTRERHNHYEIEIADDGVGFDPAQPQQDQKTHVGIANVRERLWDISRATMDIQSEPGKGTMVTIRVPKT